MTWLRIFMPFFWFTRRMLSDVSPTALGIFQGSDEEAIPEIFARRAQSLSSKVVMVDSEHSYPSQQS